MMTAHPPLRPPQPLVSIVIPAYNAAAFISRTLDSVVNQTYREFEVLVVDDGSTDRTVALVSQWAQRDRRIRLLHQANQGVGAARNLGIDQAIGQWIAPIDADDRWYPQALERLMAVAIASPETVGVVYAWAGDIDEWDQLTGDFHAAWIEGSVYLTLLAHNFLGTASASLIRRQSLEAIGGYGLFHGQQAQGCEDWDLYLRLADRYEFRVVPEFLVGYRKIRQSMSRDYSRMARSQDLMLQFSQLHHPEVPAILHNLARSSFYLYLAYQSDQTGDAATTQHWITQARQADRITPWLRPGVYALGLKQVLRFNRERQPPLTSNSLAPDIIPDLEPVQPQWLRLWLKLWVGWSFHQVMQWLSHGIAFQSRPQPVNPLYPPVRSHPPYVSS